MIPDLNHIYTGDCLEIMRRWPENFVDTIITDPPYGLSFMGKSWDGDVPGVHFWTEMFRVCKPGAMLLSFGGTRTWHHLAMAIENAGWQIRDCLMWLYASGFPKGHNFGCKCNDKSNIESPMRQMPKSDLSEAIDTSDKSGEILFKSLPKQSLSTFRETGAESKVADAKQSSVERRSDVFSQARKLQTNKICSMPERISSDGEEGRVCNGASSNNGPMDQTPSQKIGSSTSSQPQSARQSTIKHGVASNESVSQISRSGTCPNCGGLLDWIGYGTALKPAWEPIIVAMKPCEGTFAENAETWGVAGLNVDGGRIGQPFDGIRPKYRLTSKGAKGGAFGNQEVAPMERIDGESQGNPLGRWPANLILDEEAAGMLDGMSGASNPKPSRMGHPGGSNAGHMSREKGDNRYNQKGIGFWPSDNGGGASRFFYVAKADRVERNEGCEEMPAIRVDDGRKSEHHVPNLRTTPKQNFHPTVKPLELMKYLCNLTRTPTGGIVLDPFAGSGTTLWAAEFHHRPWLGIELNAEYVKIAEARIAGERAQLKLPI